jgi:hypothetical protein
LVNSTSVSRVAALHGGLVNSSMLLFADASLYSAANPDQACRKVLAQLR